MKIFRQKAAQEAKALPKKKKARMIVAYSYPGMTNPIVVDSWSDDIQQFWYRGDTLIYKYKIDDCTTVVPAHQIITMRHYVHDGYYSNDLE